MFLISFDEKPKSFVNISKLSNTKVQLKQRLDFEVRAFRFLMIFRMKYNEKTNVKKLARSLGPKYSLDHVCNACSFYYIYFLFAHTSTPKN